MKWQRSKRGILSIAVFILASAWTAAAETDEEDRLLAVLASEASAGRKAEACFRLKQIGSERAVPALAELLRDPALAHPARYALESMPYLEVDAALRTAIVQATGDLRVGLAITMGRRGDREAVPVLAGLLAEENPAVAAAAAKALGRIGGDRALAAVEEAWTHDHPPQVTMALADALARGAEQRYAAGDLSAARTLYRQLARDDSPRPSRMAGLRGLLRCAGADASAQVLAMLRGDDRLARQAAAGYIAELPAEMLPSLALAVGEMPRASQEVLLDALAARREPSLKPAAIAAARSDHRSLQLAGLRALSAVGDAAAVEVLVGALLAGDGTGPTARWSLVGLLAEGVDEALIARLATETDPARHAALVDVLTARRARGAVPVLLDQTLADDAAIRTQAMAGLPFLAGPEDVPGMIRALLKAEEGRERDDAERAVMLVCARIDDPARRADPVLAAIGRNTDAEAVEVLPLLGRIGGPAARELIGKAVESDDLARREAGVRALCNWPTDEVAEELLGLAKAASEPNHRIWSLRALIRVVTLPEGRPREEKLTLLKQAVELATRDEERRLALDRAPALRSLDAFRWVRSFLDDKRLEQEACKAVVEMAHHRELREPNAEEFAEALNRVVERCDDPQLVGRAKGYLDGR